MAARTVPIAERDAELLKVLRAAVERISMPSRGGDPVLGPFLRYGARLAISEEAEELTPFAIDPDDVEQRPTSRPETVTVLDEALGIDETEYEYDFENVVPGADWTEEAKALFWRVVAGTFAHR